MRNTKLLKRGLGFKTIEEAVTFGTTSFHLLFVPLASFVILRETSDDHWTEKREKLGNFQYKRYYEV